MDKNTTTPPTYTTTGWSQAQELRTEAAELLRTADAVERAALDALPADGCPNWCTVPINGHPWSRVSCGAAREHRGVKGAWLVIQVEVVDLPDGTRRYGDINRVRRSPVAA